MRQSLAWRALRARWHTGHYVTSQRFFHEAPEGNLTPNQLEQRVEEAIKTDQHTLELKKQKATLEAKRVTLRHAGSSHGRHNSAALAAIMKEDKALREQIAQIDADIKRRREEKYQELAQAKDKTRPGEDAYDTLTNDKHDLREAAEEFRLLLGYLHPEQRSALGVAMMPAIRPSLTDMAAGAWAAASVNFPLGITLAALLSADKLLGVRREHNKDSERLVMVDTDIYVRTAAVSEFDANKFDVLVSPARALVDQLRAWTTATAVDQFESYERAAITLFDDYIHDSRAWFRVPYFHENAPGGYGWGRVFFIGKDNCVRYLGIPGDALIESINNAPQPSLDEISWID